MTVLLQLLAKHDISLDTFLKKGRPPLGVREKRALIVTELHLSGYSWAEMCQITGLGNAAIQNLSRAKGCAAVVRKRKELGRNVGLSWKGNTRPGQLGKQWARGDFDRLRGRIRSKEERTALVRGWTPEKRAAASVRSLKLWQNPKVRDRLLDFHRDPIERSRQSKLQVVRMLQTPTTYLRGKFGWVPTPKGASSKARVRSSYEAAAISVLEADIAVAKYSYELVFVVEGGRWIIPDFLVEYSTGAMTLVEVKASWVLSLPRDHKVRQRLELSRRLAEQNNWHFEIWTEKELRNAL